MAVVSIRIELSDKGIKKFMRGQRDNPKMLRTLEKEAWKLADAAGHGFTVKHMTRRKNRPGYIVFAHYKEAQEAQVRDNRLGRAIAKLDTGYRPRFG